MSAMRVVGQQIFRHHHHRWALNNQFPITSMRRENQQLLFERSASSMPMHQQTNASNGHSAMNATSQKPPTEVAPFEEQLCPDAPLSFDTHKLVRHLESSGISTAQSEAICGALVRINQRASRHHTEQMVSKSEFAGLRSELSILEKADFALLKTDINAIEKRLETSVAEIYTAVERVENRVIKWVIAVAGAIGLGIVRLISTSGSDSKGSNVPRPPSQVSCHACRGLCARCKKGVQILDT